MRPRLRRNRHYPLSLSDSQMKSVMDAAKSLTPNQRYDYLLRLEGALKLTRINRPSDDLFSSIHPSRPQ